MPKRKEQKTYRPWESKNKTGRFFRIADDMSDSEAMKDLSDSAYRLYCNMKRVYRPATQRKGIITPSNEKNFMFPVSKWREQFSCHRDFSKSLNELVEHGFITVQECGKTTRTPNIYAFSDGWKTWTRKKTK